MGGSTSNTGSDGGLPPGAFALTSPLQGSSAQPLTPTLEWNPSDGADSYTVEVATTTTFGAADVINQSVAGPATQLVVAASTLTPGVIYDWRVTAVNAAGAVVATGAPQWFSSPYLVPGAHGIAVTPDGSKLVVASDINNGPVDVITLASHAITASISTGVASQPMGVAVLQTAARRSRPCSTNGNGGVNGIAVIDLGTNTRTGNIADPCVATTLSDVAYFPTGNEAAIPDLSSGCTAMGLTTFAPNLAAPSFQFANFSDTNDPFGVAVSPTGTFALVTMLLDDTVYKVTFPSTVTPIPVSSTTSGVAITPDGTKAVVAGGTVDVITLSTASVASVASNDTPGSDFHNVAITPDGAKAVVVGNATVQVLSLANNTILSSYPASVRASVAISA